MARASELPTPHRFNRIAKWGADSSLLALCASESHFGEANFARGFFLGDQFTFGGSRAAARPDRRDDTTFGPRPNRASPRPHVESTVCIVGRGSAARCGD